MVVLGTINYTAIFDIHMREIKGLWEKAKIPEIKTIARKVKQRFRPEENEAEDPVTVDYSTLEKTLEATDRKVRIKAKFRQFLKQVKPEDVEKVEKNLQGMKRGRIAQIWPKIQALAEMIRDPQAAWKSKTVAIAALVYLISPLDAVPDAIPFLGLADDAALIIAVVSALAYELEKYLVKQAEIQAEVQVNKYNRIVRISLLGSIAAAIIAIILKLVLNKMR